jgi:hypothetical protein
MRASIYSLIAVVFCVFTCRSSKDTTEVQSSSEGSSNELLREATKSSGWTNYSDQSDDFKHNLETAPGTLVRIFRSDTTSGIRIFTSVASVRRSGAKIKVEQPRNQQISEFLIDKSRKFYADNIIGRLTIDGQNRVQLISQDILFSTISESYIDRAKVGEKLKQLKASDANRGNYFIIIGAMLESNSYKRFEYYGRSTDLILPLPAATINVGNATYKSEGGYSNSLAVRLVLREASVFMPR